MLGLLIAVSVLLILWLLQAPAWLRTAIFAIGAVLVAGLLAVSGIDRALGPLALFALSLGLLLPGSAGSPGRSRVAPRRRKPAAGSARRRGGRAGVGFDPMEVPGYEILEKVGSGGMASVYKARKLAGGQIVALKIPMEQYVADAKFIRRFHREAEVAQRLNHVNIVRTFEHGSMGIKHYMVMEYVNGSSLESYVEAGELDNGLIVDVMKLVVSALQHIHSAGIIHRDIKPANIMILEGGIRPNDEPRLALDAVKLMDFGIAGGKVLSRLTMTGARIGTPVYMSPEQARGLKIDHRSDIYSLGLVFYEMLTGETAFKGGYEAIVHQQIFQSPPPPRQLNLRIPRVLDELVMRMIAKDPSERPSLEEVHGILEADLDEDTQGDLPSRIILTVSTRQGVLRVLDPEGALHASIGDIGSQPGSFSAAPLSVSLDSAGNFYAAVFEYQVGQTEHRMIHKLAPDGKHLASFGPYGMKSGEFLYPVSLSVAPDDTLYVLDAETHLVQRFDPDGNYLSGFGGRGEGKGLFSEPRALVVGENGAVYVLDYGNRQVQRFGPEGEYQTRWAFKLGGQQEGMRVLDGLTVDRKGNLYISDGSGSKVRKVSAAGKLVQSYAVEALPGETGESLLDLGVDEHGNLYAARRGGQAIRKYEPDGKLIATFETYAPVVQMIVDVRGVEEKVGAG
jgi:serine/threonine protein kinase/sugar lactone lactonase YvrE